MNITEFWPRDADYSHEEKTAVLRVGSGIRFLLIQGDIVDCTSRPDTLTCISIDDANDFQVAVGWVNDIGEREVVGIVAEAHPLADANRWRVSSELDGYSRMIGITGRMSEFIKNRLCVYWNNDRFYDLCQLPQPVIVVGEK